MAVSLIVNSLTKIYSSKIHIGICKNLLKSEAGKRLQFICVSAFSTVKVRFFTDIIVNTTAGISIILI